MKDYDKIIVRQIERKDIEFLRQMHNDWDTLKNLTDTHFVSEIQQEKWFEKISISNSSKRLSVLNESGNLIGLIRLDNIDYLNRSVCVGGDICLAARGQGYGKAMFSSCLDIVFNQMNMHRAYLSVLETNTIAHNMYVKFGFKQEGILHEAIFRDGRYLNYINLFLLENDYRFNIKGKVT